MSSLNTTYSQYIDYCEKRFPMKEITQDLDIKKVLTDDRWKNNLISLKFGDIFLYQIVLDKKLMTYPKLASFARFEIIDNSSIEIEYTEPIRTCEYNFKNKLKNNFHIPSKYLSHIEWSSDSILIYEIWKEMPKWYDIKPILSKTLYYRKNRKEKIKNLLNEK
jgi:hypothetical protein